MNDMRQPIPKSAVQKGAPITGRDEKLDFYRGLAMLDVVLIHTCFFPVRVMCRKLCAHFACYMKFRSWYFWPDAVRSTERIFYLPLPAS